MYGLPEARPFTPDRWLEDGDTVSLGDTTWEVRHCPGHTPGHIGLLLDGGDTWQGSYTSLKTNGMDMVECMKLLKPDAMTGHWEFTFGTERVKELVEMMDQPLLGANIFDADYAAHAGLIDMVLPEGSVDEFISMLTDSLSANAPGAMGEAKRLVNDIAHHKIDNGLMDETAKRIARARVSDEGREGVAAFLEKRAPQFRDR
mgnify:CR=1 FL=1